MERLGSRMRHYAPEMRKQENRMRAQSVAAAKKLGRR
jgi:hypothetical protein